MSGLIQLRSITPAPSASRGELPSRLVDSHGRVHTNLRLSITDRCNFRCVYCMPEETTFHPRAEILTYEELVRLARIAVRLGVDKIRLTGGEPLVRRDVCRLVAALNSIPGLRDLSLTTNGVRLPELAAELRSAGLNRLNISLDSLDPVRFQEMTRRDNLAQVMAGIEAAAVAGFNPIKINAVAIRGFTEPELLAFAELARDRRFQVRFIEFMPLDGDEGWNADRVLTQDEILVAIGSKYPLARASAAVHSDPATVYRFLDGRGEIGIVPTVSEPFCAQCNRLRITADGKLRNCLFAVDETDLKSPLRAGADDEALAWAFVDCVAAKWPGHLINQAAFARPERNMSQIGG